MRTTAATPIDHFITVGVKFSYMLFALIEIQSILIFEIKQLRLHTMSDDWDNYPHELPSDLQMTDIDNAFRELTAENQDLKERIRELEQINTELR